MASIRKLVFILCYGLTVGCVVFTVGSITGLPEGLVLLPTAVVAVLIGDRVASGFGLELFHSRDREDAGELDPLGQFFWSGSGVTYYLNKRETGLVALGMIPSTVLVSIPHWATRGVGWLLFSAASYAQVAQWLGACLAVSVNWVARSPYNQLGTRVWRYHGGYCR